jgi:hypothetical protein
MWLKVRFAKFISACSKSSSPQGRLAANWRDSGFGISCRCASAKCKRDTLKPQGAEIHWEWANVDSTCVAPGALQLEMHKRSKQPHRGK